MIYPISTFQLKISLIQTRKKVKKTPFYFTFRYISVTFNKILSLDKAK